MDYEKAYKEALERAESIYNEIAIPSATTKGICTYIFPELKESEDEMIRKKLIDLTYKVYANTSYITCVEHDDMVAWLEKQGDKDKIISEKDKLIKELGEYKVKYTQEVLGQQLEKQGGITKLSDEEKSWSNEDEYTLYETIQHLEELIRIDKAKHCACDVQYYQRDIDWLRSIKDRVQPLPKQEWSEEDDPNYVWNSENVVPKYNLNGVTDFIVSSCYGHIEGEAHTYTPEQWSAHLGFNANREFRWAYEKDLIDFN